VKKVIISVLILLSSIFIVPLTIWNIYYIDESIVDGEKYGFKINDGKAEAFNGVVDNIDVYGIKSVQIGGTVSAFKILDVKSIELSDLKEESFWVLMLDDNNSFLNTIKLEFKDDKLKRIYRHRQLFELP